MEAVILIGIQASGKTTFCRERFFDTHVRISLDMLGTRHRERILIEACLKALQPFVIDNTNVLAAERGPYIAAAKAAGFRVAAYYFRTGVREAIGRNNRRTEKQKIPVPGILAKYKRLEPPSAGEGFDRMCLVEIDPEGGFTVAEWPE
jgi:predicted kinase